MKKNNKKNEIKIENSLFKRSIIGITLLTITLSIVLTITINISSTKQITRTDTKNNEVSIVIQPIFCIGANACNIE